jgi:hypothetical protein
VTLPPPYGPPLLEISMIQPSCPIDIAAASQMQIADVALGDRSKYRAHAGHLHPGRTFVSASVEKYRHLGKLVIHYVCTLCNITLARALLQPPMGLVLQVPTRTECSACTASGICVPLLRAVACQGCGAAGVARRGYALP